MLCSLMNNAPCNVLLLLHVNTFFRSLLLCAGENANISEVSELSVSPEDSNSSKFYLFYAILYKIFL